MRLLIYTSVFGHYDWVFPPVETAEDVNYILVTDNPETQVTGWQSLVVDSEKFESSRAASRYYKMLPQKAFPNFDYSLYVDGNIRLLGDIKPVFNEFIASKACLGLFKHPLRTSVQEEVEACLKAAKLVRTDRLKKELSFYQQEDFPDNVGLFEAGVMLRNHRHPDINPSMNCWWSLYQQFGSRDQFSLPYVIWKTGVPCAYHPYSFRDPNPYFGIYTHRGDDRAPRHYAYVEGRAYDSLFYASLLKSWHIYWTIRRALRKQ